MKWERQYNRDGRYSQMYKSSFNGNGASASIGNSVINGPGIINIYTGDRLDPNNQLLTT